MRAIVALVALGIGLTGCSIDPVGLVLAPGWKAKSIAVWRHARPDMIAPTPDGRWAYVSLENPAGISSPSLAGFAPHQRRQVLLISGLHRADGLKLAPDGSLWIGEEHDAGLIWRVAEPSRLPADQHVERVRLEVSHPSIAPLFAAGRFAHEGIAFSRDGRFAYLADEHPRGCLFRLSLASHRLRVFHATRGWLPIAHPLDARAEGWKARCTAFRRIEDMETLPDGRVLMAETDRGQVLALDDRGAHPTVAPFLARSDLGHPDNLAWDPTRRWLWITDDSRPSRLLAWDGRNLLEIARHDDAEITGVVVVGREVWINLQGRRRGVDLTVALREHAPAP